MSNSYTILVIEDEEPIRGFVKINLKRENYNVLEASSGEEGIEKARKEDVDVVVLDIMLPGIDGFQVCKILREEFPAIGIIMLTAKSQDIDKIEGLECGTDDYMIKPFNPKELILRIKSLIRRIDTLDYVDDNEIIIDYPFKIDTYSRKFYKGDHEVELTPTEYAIVKIFIESPGKAFKRNEILDWVWGYDFVGDPKIVDVNIRRLRAKIEDNPANPTYIETVWGVGYRWNNQR